MPLSPQIPIGTRVESEADLNRNIGSPSLFGPDGNFHADEVLDATSAKTDFTLCRSSGLYRH